MNLKFTFSENHFCSIISGKFDEKELLHDQQVEEAFADAMAEIEEQSNDQQKLLIEQNTENLPQFKQLTIKDDKKVVAETKNLVYQGSIHRQNMKCQLTKYKYFCFSYYIHICCCI